MVERWNPFARIRQDMFGVFDILDVRPGFSGVRAVQCTSGGNVLARVKKSLLEPRVKVWLECGNTFEVWGYLKAGKRGEKKLWRKRRIIAFLTPSGEVNFMESK